MKWYLTIIAAGRVLFNGDARSREEVEQLAGKRTGSARTVEILIGPPIGKVYHYE